MKELAVSMEEELLNEKIICYKDQDAFLVVSPSSSLCGTCYKDQVLCHRQLLG